MSQMAQACLAEGSADVSYGFPADIWALGILACELLVGASPFEGDTKEETYAKILAGKMQLPSYLSSEARDFIHKACFNPQAGCCSLTHVSCLAHRHAWAMGWICLRHVHASVGTWLKPSIMRSG